MPRIHCVEDEQATGELADVYARWKEEHPGRDRMPGILKCFSAQPKFLQAIMDGSYSMHFVEGHLTRRVKEMLATYVSALNQCRY